MPRTDHLRDMYGKPFVHEQLAEWSLATRVPIRVVASCTRDELSHLASAAGRGVANGVCDFMGQPEGNQLRVEAEALGVGICDRGEVLEAGEGDAAAINHQLARVRGAHAHHEDYIDVNVLFEQFRAPLLSGACERDHVSAFEHLAKVGSIGQRGGANDVGEVWSIAVNNVVLPVRLEDSAVSLKVALIGGDPVGAIENGKKIGQQVDQHSAGSDPREVLQDPSHVRERRVVGALDAE
jgi:hypothetical protein